MSSTSPSAVIVLDDEDDGDADMNEEEKLSACKSRCPANAEEGTFFVKLLRPLKDLSLSRRNLKFVSQ